MHSIAKCKTKMLKLYLVVHTDHKSSLSQTCVTNQSYTSFHKVVLYNEVSVRKKKLLHHQHLEAATWRFTTLVWMKVTDRRIISHHLPSFAFPFLDDFLQTHLLDGSVKPKDLESPICCSRLIKLKKKKKKCGCVCTQPCVCACFPKKGA